MAKLVESEQRYYSVTSAAGMIREMIEGKTVEVVRTVVTEETKQYNDTSRLTTTVNNSIKNVSDTTSFSVKEKNSAGGTVIKSYGDIVTKYKNGTIDTTQLKKNGTQVTDESSNELIWKSFVTYAAQKLVPTSEVKSENPDNTKKYPPGKLEKDETNKIVIKIMDRTTNNVLDAVVLDETISSTNKSLTFVIGNAKKSESVTDNYEPDIINPYRMTLTFKCDSKTTEGTSTSEGDRIEISDNVYQYQLTTTTTTKTTMNWNLTSIKTGGNLTTVPAASTEAEYVEDPANSNGT